MSCGVVVSPSPHAQHRWSRANGRSDPAAAFGIAALAVEGGSSHWRGVRSEVRQLLARIDVALGDEHGMARQLVPVLPEPRGLRHVRKLGLAGEGSKGGDVANVVGICLLYTSPSPRDRTRSRMPSSA